MINYNDWLKCWRNIHNLSFLIDTMLPKNKFTVYIFLWVKFEEILILHLECVKYLTMLQEIEIALKQNQGRRAKI
jgi:hypothetical protein